jgi:hypothetical protein
MKKKTSVAKEEDNVGWDAFGGGGLKFPSYFEGDTESEGNKVVTKSVQNKNLLEDDDTSV